MLCSDFLSDLYLSRYNSLIWIGAVRCVHIPRLFWIRHLEMFWGLKNYSMTKTDILWYDLHEHTCYYSCDLHISSPLLSCRCLPWILDYPLCMTHDFATAHLHDFAWTDKWAQNISTLSRQMFLMRLWCDHQDLGWRGHLYETKGTWKVLQLAMPYWMWVLWPSWGGRTFIS